MKWADLLAVRPRWSKPRSAKGGFRPSSSRAKSRFWSIEALEERLLLANFLNLVVARADDAAFPTTEFITTIDLNIPDVGGVTGVNVTLGGGGGLSLENVAAGRWFGEASFISLADAKAGVNGVWMIDINGSNPSDSNFTLDISPASDGDFFLNSTVTNPVHGANNVPANTTFTWTDPTGGATPDAIQVVSQDDAGTLIQLDDSLSGTLNVTDTSWTPPSNLVAGANDFDIFYLDATTGFVGDFSVTGGSITWSDSPFDPNPGGNPTPLVNFGSQTIVGFNVGGGGSGNDTAGLFDPAAGKFFLKNTNSAGTADLVFRFGPAGVGWTPITGDWDGNPTTTIGLFDPAAGKFFLENSNSAGTADLVFRFGPAGVGWTPVTGDWDGNVTDTVGLFDPAAGKFFLKNSNTPGIADTVFRFGPAGAGWTPITGDWDSISASSAAFESLVSEESALNTEPLGNPFAWNSSEDEAGSSEAESIELAAAPLPAPLRSAGIPNSSQPTADALAADLSDASDSGPDLSDEALLELLEGEWIESLNTLQARVGP